MLTVVIAEQRYIDSIREENSLFFEPFLKNREVAFCVWKPEGQTLRESVPGLMEAVGREREWRAFIIQSCSDEQKQLQNPFDEADSRPITSIPLPPGLPSGDWPSWVEQWNAYYEALAEAEVGVYHDALTHPLASLATWLCFRPADYVLGDIEEKQDEVDWAMDQLGDNKEKASAQLELMEVAHYRRTIKRKEQIRREFVEDRPINIARPIELFCVSERLTENGFFDPGAYWAVRADSRYSHFVERNMYFDNMRFMVFDILPKTHVNYRYDMIRFLFNVMIMATNPIPGSSMRPRRLYQLISENDETPLRTLATSFVDKLSATSEILDREIDQIRKEIPRELTDREAEHLFLKESDVPVMLDKECRTDLLYVSKTFGFATDCPEDEEFVWAARYQKVEKELAFIVKRQGRILRKCSEQTKVLSDVDQSEIGRLTSFQMEDVREFAEKSENQMVQRIPPDFSDITVYAKPMETNSAKVKNVIGRRMGKKTTILLGVAALVLFLLSMLPLFFHTIEYVPGSFSTELTLIGTMLGLILVIMLITLLCLRRPLTKSAKDFNNGMREIENDIHNTMDGFSQYLSDVCNVRRGYEILAYAQNNPDHYAKRIQVRKRHQEDIRHKRALLLEQYKDYISDASYTDPVMVRPYEYDFEQTREYPYPAPFLAGDVRQVEFLDGSKVSVPSSFVRRMYLRMEEIYDD